jgi:hypothetical protein
LEATNGSNARSGDLDYICNIVLPPFINPVPSRDTVRDWLDTAKVPKFKANPVARRGGGRAYYSISHVEKMLRSRTIGGGR